MPLECKPVYLIAGGRRSRQRRGPDPLIREALLLAGIRSPTVAYVGTASGDNALFRIMISRQLAKAGAGAVRLAPLCGARADPAKAARIIEDSRIVFISGGDVEQGMRILESTGMDGFLRDQYREGKLFFGVSAGSIILAKKWVRWSDSVEGSGPELFPCLGVAQVYCDTHDEEDNWEELRTLARLLPAGSEAYGIPSGAALVAYSDGDPGAAGGQVHRFKRTGRAVIQMQSLLP